MKNLSLALKENKRRGNLYESLIKGISKGLKETLNEGSIGNNSVKQLWNNIVDDGIATEAELQLVTDINGYSEETLNDVMYARTGYHTWEQYSGEETEDDEYDEDEGIEATDGANPPYNDEGIDWADNEL